MLSNTDSNARTYRLAKAFREMFGWDAKNLILTQTYLDFPYDWQLDNNVTEKEVNDFAEECDFFIWLDGMFEDDNLSLIDLCGPLNSCILGAGSPIRYKLKEALIAQTHDVNIIAPLQDPSMAPKLLTTPFSSLIVDYESIDNITKGIKKRDGLTFICPYTKYGSKGVDKFVDVMKKFPDVDFITVTQMKWTDTIKLKAECHGVLNQVNYGALSMNDLEALYMGMPSLTNLSPWCYSIWPELRNMSIITINKSMNTSLENAIEAMIQETNRAHDTKAMRDFVMRNFSPEVVATKWYYYIKWIMGGKQ